MNRWSMVTIGVAIVWLAVLGDWAIFAQDKYAVKVPGGLAFSDFRGYEGWQAIGISRNDRVMAGNCSGVCTNQTDRRTV